MPHPKLARVNEFGIALFVMIVTVTTPLKVNCHILHLNHENDYASQALEYNVTYSGKSIKILQSSLALQDFYTLNGK
jgi:hypothetical protein